MKKNLKKFSRAMDARIGLLVHDARKAKNIKQTELAPLLGLDQSALSRVETGRQQLSASQWVLLHQIGLLSKEAISSVLVVE